jgi:hypothetical protein
MAMGGLILLAIPVALLVVRDRPADKGLHPDGLTIATADFALEPISFSGLLRQRAFLSRS